MRFTGSPYWKDLTAFTEFIQQNGGIRNSLKSFKKAEDTTNLFFNWLEKYSLNYLLKSINIGKKEFISDEDDRLIENILRKSANDFLKINLIMLTGADGEFVPKENEPDRSTAL